GAGGPGLRGRAPRRGSGAPRGEGSSAPGAGTPGRRWGLRRRRAGAGPRAGLRDRYAGHGALRREPDQGDDPQHLSARVQHAVRRAGRAVRLGPSGRDTLNWPVKLIIQIPCFNEEDHLAATLAAPPHTLPPATSAEPLVIDDGS